MSDLDKLWEIEQHHRHLQEYNEKLNQLEDNKDLVELEKMYRSGNLKLHSLKLENTEKKSNIRKLEREIEVHKDKLSIAEKTLYNGSVKDLKQLEHLDKEKEYHKKAIDSLEDDILSLMEDCEGIDEDISVITEKLKDTEEKLKARIDFINNLVSQLKESINREEETLKVLTGTLDKKLLEKYNGIQNRKKTGMAIIKDNVCSGCHMHISENIIEKTKAGTSVTTCENCGRILYFKEE